MQRGYSKGEKKKQPRASAAGEEAAGPGSGSFRSHLRNRRLAQSKQKRRADGLCPPKFSTHAKILVHLGCPPPLSEGALIYPFWKASRSTNRLPPPQARTRRLIGSHWPDGWGGARCYFGAHAVILGWAEGSLNRSTWENQACTLVLSAASAAETHIHTHLDALHKHHKHTREAKP